MRATNRLDTAQEAPRQLKAGRPPVSRSPVVVSALARGRRHVPEGGGGRCRSGGHRLPDERRLLRGRRRRDLGRLRGGAGAGAVVHRALRLLRRPRQLLRDAFVPVRHVRAGGGDRGPGLDVVRRERGAVHAHHRAHGVFRLHLLLLLPLQAARAVRPRGGPLRRLLRPLLLRALRALPGVPRARQPGLRHGHRLARQRREAAGARRRHHAAADARRDDPLNSLKL